jgi:hypothetical protein
VVAERHYQIGQTYSYKLQANQGFLHTCSCKTFRTYHLIFCQRLKFTGIFGSNTLFVYTRKLTLRAGRRQKKILTTDSSFAVPKGRRMDFTDFHRNKFQQKIS